MKADKSIAVDAPDLPPPPGPLLPDVVADERANLLCELDATIRHLDVAEMRRAAAFVRGLVGQR